MYRMANICFLIDYRQNQLFEYFISGISLRYLTILARTTDTE